MCEEGDRLADALRHDGGDQGSGEGAFHEDIRFVQEQTEASRDDEKSHARKNHITAFEKVGRWFEQVGRKERGKEMLLSKDLVRKISHVYGKKHPSNICRS